MDNSDDSLADVCEGKTGAELFRELKRIYSEVVLEDYYKGGQWQDHAMRTDWVLIDAHRREAGAPAPPPLSEIPEPELPVQRVLTLPGSMFANKGQDGVVPGIRPAVVPGAAGGVVPGFLRPPAAAKLMAVAPKASPALELRDCAIFISKNKLDPSKAKAMLMALTADRRKHVMDSFKTDKIGVEATEDLEQFIAASAPAGSSPDAGSVVKPPGRISNGTVSSFGAEELKKTAQFIAKNKLDPTRAKTALMKLSAEQRKLVIESFSSVALGLEATKELEAYAAELQEPPSKKAKVA